MAMMSRGYNGDVRIMQEFEMIIVIIYIAGATAISLSALLVLTSQNIIRV